MPSVSNPLDKVAMQTLTDVNVLNAVAIPGFEMELVEGARAAGQVAGEVAEGFWSSLWTGIKSAGKFMGEVAEGFAVIYPQYQPPTPWKQMEYDEAFRNFQIIQENEHMRWHNSDCWWLLSGYWYKARSKIPVEGSYSVYHPWTSVDITYEYVDTANGGKPAEGARGNYNVYAGLNRLQLASVFQPLPNYIGYWSPAVGPLVPFKCRVRYMIKGWWVLVEGEFRQLIQDPYRIYGSSRDYLSLWFVGGFQMKDVWDEMLFTTRFRMPLTEIDLFPLTKAVIQTELDNRENPPEVESNQWVPQYPVGHKWNSMDFPTGKLIIVKVPDVSDGLYSYIIITTKGEDPEFILTTTEEWFDKWELSGFLEPYTDEWESSIPKVDDDDHLIEDDDTNAMHEQYIVLTQRLDNSITGGRRWTRRNLCWTQRAPRALTTRSSARWWVTHRPG
mgnify:CR=1 FL=1